MRLLKLIGGLAVATIIMIAAYWFSHQPSTKEMLKDMVIWSFYFTITMGVFSLGVTWATNALFDCNRHWLSG